MGQTPKAGNVGQLVEKCKLHCCKEHILGYNIHNNCNPPISPSFSFLASNICNFCDRVNFQRFRIAVNFVSLKIETSNFQELLSYLYAAVHIEKST